MRKGVKTLQLYICGTKIILLLALSLRKIPIQNFHFVVSRSVYSAFMCALLCVSHPGLQWFLVWSVAYRSMRVFRKLDWARVARVHIQSDKQMNERQKLRIHFPMVNFVFRKWGARNKKCNLTFWCCAVSFELRFLILCAGIFVIADNSLVVF